MPSIIRCVVVCVLMMFVAQAAQARQEKAAGGADGAAASMPPLAKEALDRAVRVYGALSTYQDHLELSYHVVTKDKAGKSEDVPEETREVDASFARPRSFKVTMDDMSVLSDGSKVYSLWEQGDQYIEQPFPDDLEEALNDETGYFVRASFHPILTSLLRNPKSAGEFFRSRIAVEKAVEEDLDGEPCIKISGKVSDPREQHDPIPGSYWFSKKSGLLLRITQDMTELAKDMPNADDEGGEITSAMWDLRFKDAQLDKAIAPSDFKPGEDMKRVEQFSRGGPDDNDNADDEDDEEGSQLLGRPAPEFTGKLIDGSEFKLSSLKGRVVVMDFWATWCPPCVASIPSIQKLSEKMADQPVTIIGINQDQGNTRVVKNFTDKKKITFQQVMDTGSIGSQYSVTGIPTTVVLDKEGVVQFVHVGGSETAGDEIGEKVERLLKGEKLAAAPGEKAKKERAPETMPLEDLDASRVIEGQHTMASVQPMGMHEGVAKDSSTELLLPTTDGSLVIISGKDASMKTVRLAGTGVGHVMVQSVERATLEGKSGFLTTGMSFNGSRGSTAVASFYDESGAKVWEFSPRAVKGTFANVYVAVGDVLGEGSDQVVIGYNIMAQGGGGGRKNAAWLSVLDREGKPRITKRVGQAIYGLWIAGAGPDGGAKGEGRTIVVLDGTVRRFHIGKDSSGDAAGGAAK